MIVDPAAQLAELSARVAAAPKAEINRAVTDADVRTLAALPPADLEDVVAALAGIGCKVSVLRARLKEARREARRPPPPSLRVVREGDEPQWEDPRAWERALRRNDEGDPLALLDNALAILRNAYAGRLSYDVMALRPHLDGRPMQDEDVTRLRGEIGAGQRCTIQKGDFRDALCLVAREQREFHPVQDYLRRLVWDGVPRLWTAAKEHIGLDDLYSNRVLGRTLVAAVARGLVREHAPVLGTMVKTVTIILGSQDQKKSTFWSVIGGPFFMDSRVDIDDRKGAITLQSCWICEFPEIDGMLSRHSNEGTKAWAAQRSDTVVPIYGAAPVTTPRTFLVVATTNKPRFLTDPTGSSRWLILDVRGNGDGWAVDVEKLEAARDQLFAEAVAEFDAYLVDKAAGVRGDENPHRWWMNRAENRERATRNEEHQVENAWGPSVGAWLAGAPASCQACRGTGGSGGGCPTCTGSGEAKRGPLPVDELGREYVTLDRVLLECVGVPLERIPKLRVDMTDTLGELHWYPGKRIRPLLPGGSRSRNWLTPYYREEEPPTAADLAAEGHDWKALSQRREALARELDAVDLAQEAAVRAGAAEAAGDGGAGDAEPFG